MSMHSTPHTTPAGESAATDRLRGDWDAGGTASIYLPIDVAERLLAERGWQPEHASDGCVIAWISPSGKRYWETSEALQVALVAENA